MVQRITDLSPIEIVALGSIKSGAARDEVRPGEHDVDFTVRVQGKIKIGEDVERAPTSHLPHLAVMALFIQRMGCQREHATAMLLSCMHEAITMDGNSRDTLLQNFPEIAGAEEGIRIMMANLPPVKARGPVNSNLSVVPV